MILYQFLCNLLFIPVIYSSTVTPRADQSLLKSSPEVVSHRAIVKKYTLANEGGSLLPDNSMMLSNGNTILADLDEAISTKKEKPVARRNGVGSPLEDKITHSQNSSQLKTNDSVVEHVKTNNTSVTEKQKLEGNKTVTTNKTPVHSNIEKPIAAKVLNTSQSKNENITSKNDTLAHDKVVKMGISKKPLVLRYEDLMKMGDISAVPSSAKTVISDQMSLNKHPGMIMPVVITILVVPMFAVLGYMAFRRGQEAWKNRHYKRMDFLLDGMYND